jgi:hypothetical protein
LIPPLFIIQADERREEEAVSWASLSLVISETIKPYMIIIVLDGKNQKEEGN